MHKPFIATSLVVASVVGIGLTGALVGGDTAGFAAGSGHKHAAAKTGRPHAAGKATRRHAAGQSGTPHADGQITAVNGNTITVKPDADPAGSTEYKNVTTIVLSSSTQYRTGNGSTTTTKPTISVGQYIVAEGTVSSDGKTLTATLVSVGNGGPGHGGPGRASGPHADGTVTAVNGDAISVQADADRAGSNEYTAVTTINLTGTTTYDTDRGNTATTTKPTITVGEYIVAEGTLSADGKTLTATHVSLHAGGPGGH